MFARKTIYGFLSKRIAEKAAAMARDSSPKIPPTKGVGLPKHIIAQTPGFVCEAKTVITAADKCRVDFAGTGICYLLQRSLFQEGNPLVYWTDEFGRKIEVRVFNIEQFEYPAKSRFLTTQMKDGDLWVIPRSICDPEEEPSSSSSESSQESESESESDSSSSSPSLDNPGKGCICNCDNTAPDEPCASHFYRFACGAFNQPAWSILARCVCQGSEFAQCWGCTTDVSGINVLGPCTPAREGEIMQSPCTLQSGCDIIDEEICCDYNFQQF